MRVYPFILSCVSPNSMRIEYVYFGTGQDDGIRCVATQQRMENETNSFFPEFAVVFSEVPSC